jgi:hypothetical protein
MSATDVPLASMATSGTVQTGGHEQRRAFDRDDVGGARLLIIDMRVGSLLMREARRRVVTRMFGVPVEGQSFLVTIAVLGAAATVLRGVVARPLPRPSGTDLAIGGAVVNTGLRGIAGPPSANIPLAGALIGSAVLAHSLRPAAAESVREIRRLARGFGTVFGAVFFVPRR